MKKLITSLLILSAFTVAAQKIQLPDDSKVVARCYPTMGTPIPCGGVGKIKSVDLDWRPMLVRKPIEIEHEGAGEDLESIKAEQWLLKMANEKKGIKAEAKTTSVTPVVGTNFAGYAPDGSSPLDNSIAVSNGGIIVSVENSTISGFNATTGVGLFTANLVTFLPFTGIYGVCDPVVIYDPTKDRFILFCQEVGATGLFPNNRIFVCFSQTNNPSTGGWWCYSFAGDPAGTGDGFDYPKLAINDTELFISGNLYYEPGGTFHKPMLFQMDKLAGFTGGSLSYAYYSTIVGSPFTLLPVSYGQGANITSGMLLVSTNSGGGSNINLYSISGLLTGSPTMSYYPISTTPYMPPANALQLGTSTVLNTGDCRALNGFFLDGIIHFVFNCSSGGYSAINYNRLTVASLSNTSSTFSMSGFDCVYPALASFATTTTDRSVMIGFGRSGSSITPEIRAVNCDNSMSWSASTLVKSGAYVSYSGATARWGDYTGMSRRHTSTTPSVWLSGGWGNTSKHWATWVSEIHSGSTAVCPMPTGLTATTITSTSAVVSWTAAAGAMSYNIQYRKVGTTSWTTTTTTATTKTITGLAAHTNYEYQVEAVCTVSSSSGYTTSSNFTTLSGVSVPTVAGQGSRIYPNPVADVFYVEFPLTEDCQLNISLVDMSGRLVKELYNDEARIGNNAFSFNKANLSTGTYLLVIRANNETIRNEKIVIAN